MNVKQESVTIRRVMPNDFGMPVMTRHQVVVNHRVRSRMLLTLFQQLQYVTLEDVKKLLDLVEEYLSQPRQLHSYYKWSRTVNGWVIGINPEQSTEILDQLLRIKTELKHCWSFEPERA